jgi:hypothetical protein
VSTLQAEIKRSFKYDETLMRLARTIGLDTSNGVGVRLYDPYAREFGRHSNTVRAMVEIIVALLFDSVILEGTIASAPRLAFDRHHVRHP